VEQEKKAKFVNLFQEFIDSYPRTIAGMRHQSLYETERNSGRRNYEAILSAKQSGEDVTESVFLQLLPNTNSANNRSKGAWIHHSSCFFLSENLHEWFKKNNRFQEEDSKKIANSILVFLSQCNDNPQQLAIFCRKFGQLRHSYLFCNEVLSPILNSLRPDDFLLIDQKSLQVINYFANTSYEWKLTDYPEINHIGHKLIEKLAPEMRKTGSPALRDADLFDMFCRWLIDVKKYEFFPNQQTIAFNDINECTLDFDKVHLQPEYSLTKCAQETGFEETVIERWVRGIERKKQAIFSGSPGTGKTYIADKIAQYLISGSDGFWELVQFHSAYAYEDFIQGIRPQSQKGQLTYPLIPGTFLNFCQKAESCQGKCVLIIDEINRANLAQVFGELMYLLEYRNRAISLASGGTLRIPENVRIIGTMNTADRSISLVDHALRRRFVFIEIRPNYDVLRKFHQKLGYEVEGLIETLKQLNDQIADKHYEVGISFFLTDKLTEQIQDIWEMEIEPYLEEYFFDQPDKVDEFRFIKVQSQVSPLSY
jgi:5-methylcytosine-specific restriction protein B